MLRTLSYLRMSLLVVHESYSTLYSSFTKCIIVFVALLVYKKCISRDLSTVICFIQWTTTLPYLYTSFPRKLAKTLRQTSKILFYKSKETLIYESPFVMQTHTSCSVASCWCTALDRAFKQKAFIRMRGREWPFLWPLIVIGDVKDHQSLKVVSTLSISFFN